MLRMQALPEISSIDPDLRSSRVFSTQSESEGTDTSATSGRGLPSLKLPHVVESLCLCYLAFVLLRLPVTFGDVFDWLSTDGFPFITAYEELPRAMTRKLPPAYREGLQPRVSPTGV